MHLWARWARTQFSNHELCSLLLRAMAGEVSPSGVPRSNISKSSKVFLQHISLTDNGVVARMDDSCESLHNFFANCGLCNARSLKAFLPQFSDFPVCFLKQGWQMHDLQQRWGVNWAIFVDWENSYFSMMISLGNSQGYLSESSLPMRPTHTPVNHKGHCMTSTPEHHNGPDPEPRNVGCWLLMIAHDTSGIWLTSAFKSASCLGSRCCSTTLFTAYPQVLLLLQSWATRTLRHLAWAQLDGGQELVRLLAKPLTVNF